MTLFTEVTRWAVVLLAGLSLALLIAGTMLRAEQLTPRERRTRPWVGAVLAVVAYGAGEAAAQDAEGGLRGALMLGALTGLVVAMLWRFGDVDGR